LLTASVDCQQIGSTDANSSNADFDIVWLKLPTIYFLQLASSRLRLTATNHQCLTSFESVKQNKRGAEQKQNKRGIAEQKGDGP
jgi:hypothetical protein